MRRVGLTSKASSAPLGMVMRQVCRLTSTASPRRRLAGQLAEFVGSKHDRQHAVLEAVAVEDVAEALGDHAADAESSSDQTADSRELPHPKLWPASRIGAPLKRLWFKTKSGLSLPSGR